jgi:hypothetical protein
MKLRNKRYVIMQAGIGVIAGVITVLGMKALGVAVCSVAMGVLLVLFGCLALISSLVNKSDWWLKLVIVPEQEQQEIAMLKGKTEEELQKLIKFHLKSGNFSQADECSRKLLALVENQNKSVDVSE